MELYNRGHCAFAIMLIEVNQHDGDMIYFRSDLTNVEVESEDWLVDQGAEPGAPVIPPEKRRKASSVIEECK